MTRDAKVAQGFVENRTVFNHLRQVGSLNHLFGWWVTDQAENEKRSFAELHDPSGVREVCEFVAIALDGWEPTLTYQSEKDLAIALAEYLRIETDFDVKISPGDSAEPDILVADLLALKIKVDLSRKDCIQCIDQSAAYARQWMTWIIVVDSSESAIGLLQRFLADKELGHLLVWDFQ